MLSRQNETREAETNLYMHAFVTHGYESESSKTFCLSRELIYVEMGNTARASWGMSSKMR